MSQKSSYISLSNPNPSQDLLFYIISSNFPDITALVVPLTTWLNSCINKSEDCIKWLATTPRSKIYCRKPWVAFHFVWSWWSYISGYLKYFSLPFTSTSSLPARASTSSTPADFVFWLGDTTCYFALICSCIVLIMFDILFCEISICVCLWLSRASFLEKMFIISPRIYGFPLDPLCWPTASSIISSPWWAMLSVYFYFARYSDSQVVRKLFLSLPNIYCAELVGKDIITIISILFLKIYSFNIP